MILTRYEAAARLKAALMVLLIVTIVVAPLSYAISARSNDVVFALGAGLALGVGIALRAGGRGGELLGIGVGCVAGLAAAFVASNTSGRAIGLLVPPVVGLCIGFMEGIETPHRRTYRQTVLSAVIIGTIIGVGMSIAINWPGLLAGLISGLLVGVFAGSLQDSPRGSGRRFTMPPVGLLMLAGLSIALVTALAWREFSSWWSAVLCVLMLTWIVPALCYLLGRTIARWLRPRLIIYNDLAGYLRVMWVPMGGFALGYLALIVAFAGFYGALYRWSPASFGPGGPNPMIEWLFYSLFVATGQEYAGISPVSNWARMLVSLETILCLGWMVVVFAAVMVYLQPRLESVANGASNGERRNVD